MRGTRKEKGKWIFVLQTSNKTECMCTNAIKCEKEKRKIFMWRHVVTTTSSETQKFLALFTIVTTLQKHVSCIAIFATNAV
jgi:hypothetical protein